MIVTLPELFLLTIALWSNATTAHSLANDHMDMIRQSDLNPPSSIRVVNESAAAELEEQARVNASSSLSNTSLSDIENDNITQKLQMKYRERKKQERLFVIQTQILQRLRINRQPNITVAMFSEDDQKKIAMLVERMHLMRTQHDEVQNPVRLFMQRLQSFYPSCSLPNNTERRNWEDPSTFRILYDVSQNHHSFDGTEISVMHAKLRLYKIGFPDNDPNFTGWDSALSALPRYNLLDSLVRGRITNGINVSIFQYLKPLRLNRKERKRLVDSRTIHANHQGWVEFDVMSSLNHWLHHSNKNYGFDVVVEDAFGKKLNPNHYFQNMNCSSENANQDLPFPNIMELHPEMGENDSSLFDNETYPTLDLQTADIPREDFEFHAGDVTKRVLRKRHTYGNRKERTPNTHCQKEDIYFSFEELGLKELIAFPEGLNWSFCTGSCDQSYDGISSYSQILQAYFPFKYFARHKTQQQSSCTPGNRTALQVLLFDNEGQLFQTTFQNFIPQDCVCTTS